MGRFTIGCLILGLSFLFSGCQWLPGRIKLGNASVVGVKDAGVGASLASSTAGASVALAAGSVVTVVKESAQPAIPATKDNPGSPRTPEREITTITPSAPTVWEKKETATQANTGTVDTSVREHEIDAAETRPLLYAAIVSALAAGFFVYRAYPTPAMCCGGASLVFFIAWKVSGIPSWFWGIGLAAIVGGGALYLGHNRGINESAAPKDEK